MHIIEGSKPDQDPPLLFRVQRAAPALAYIAAVNTAEKKLIQSQKWQLVCGAAH